MACLLYPEAQLEKSSETMHPSFTRLSVAGKPGAASGRRAGLAQRVLLAVTAASRGQERDKSLKVTSQCTTDIRSQPKCGSE